MVRFLSGRGDSNARVNVSMEVLTLAPSPLPTQQTARLMVETAVAKNSDGAISSLMPGPELGLAVFDKKGELSRAEGVVARPGGLLEVKGIGPHAQAGDIDFQVCFRVRHGVH